MVLIFTPLEHYLQGFFSLLISLLTYHDQGFVILRLSNLLSTTTMQRMG